MLCSGQKRCCFLLVQLLVSKTVFVVGGRGGHWLHVVPAAVFVRWVPRGLAFKICVFEFRGIQPQFPLRQHKCALPSVYQFSTKVVFFKSPAIFLFARALDFDWVMSRE